MLRCEIEEDDESWKMVVVGREKRPREFTVEKLQRMILQRPNSYIIRMNISTSLLLGFKV